MPGSADFNLGFERKRGRLLSSCLGIAILSVPLILRVVPPNGVYGFRTSATFSDPAIWYSANAFLGWALLVAAITGATLLIMLPSTAKRWRLWVSFLVPVLGAVASSFAYLQRFR